MTIISGAKGEIERIQNGRFRMESSSVGFSSTSSLHFPILIPFHFGTPNDSGWPLRKPCPGGGGGGSRVFFDDNGNSYRLALAIPPEYQPMAHEARTIRDSLDSRRKALLAMSRLGCHQITTNDATT
jgi:hypothetical protein